MIVEGGFKGVYETGVDDSEDKKAPSVTTSNKCESMTQQRSVKLSPLQSQLSHISVVYIILLCS